MNKNTVKNALKKIMWKTLVAAGLFSSGYVTRYYVDRDALETKKALDTYNTKKDSIAAHYTAELDKAYHNLDMQAAADKREEADQTLARIDSLERAQESALNREARATLNNMQNLHAYVNTRDSR